MSDFARYRVQCARRLYWCDWCHRYRIAQGDHYLYGFGITNGQKSATRLCTHCLTGSLRDSDVGQVWAAWAFQ